MGCESHCVTCNKSINLGMMGTEALRSHMQCIKHKMVPTASITFPSHLQHRSWRHVRRLLEDINMTSNSLSRLCVHIEPLVSLQEIIQLAVASKGCQKERGWLGTLRWLGPKPTPLPSSPTQMTNHCSPAPGQLAVCVLMQVSILVPYSATGNTNMLPIS